MRASCSYLATYNQNPGGSGLAGAENGAGLLQGASDGGDGQGGLQVAGIEVLLAPEGDGAGLPGQDEEVVVAEDAGDLRLQHHVRRHSLG